MVERQPEKLNVVGSNPILNKMSTLVIYSLLLIYYETAEQLVNVHLPNFIWGVVKELFSWENYYIIWMIYYTDVAGYVEEYGYCIAYSLVIIFIQSNSILTRYNLYFLLHYFLNNLIVIFTILKKNISKLKHIPLWVSFIKWKPLFKKSSYFSIYRSTKNRFLNK